MNDGETPLDDGLAARVARHAALADSARLRITDLLAVGDRSPGDLQRELRISSSLLAHHLGVLERANLIRRTRSQGDRRRSYIQLRSSVLDRLVPARTIISPQVRRPRRVVFVCTGNSARSPLAAALWERASAIVATSAGTHPVATTSPKAIAAAERHGLRLAPRIPRGLDDVIAAGDLVITVCDRAYEELRRRDALHWSVPNPGLVGTDAAYDEAFEQIAARVTALAPRLVPA